MLSENCHLRGCSSKYSGHICALACVLAQATMSLKIGAQCGSWALHLLLLAKAFQTSGYDPGQASLVCIAACPFCELAFC